MPLFPLVIVVILAGLLLGGVLAHFFGSRSAPVAAPTAAAVAPSAVETPEPVLTTIPSATPSPAPTITTTPVASPSATPAPAKSAKRVAAVTLLAHKPILTPLPSPAGPRPTQTPPPAPAPTKSASIGTGGDRASAIVRSYLEAIARGDRLTATSYLSRGLPSETFMNSGAHIESIASSSTGPQQYRVSVDVQSSTGEYYAIFTVESGPSGLQITDHYAIKTQ